MYFSVGFYGPRCIKCNVWIVEMLACNLVQLAKYMFTSILQCDSCVLSCSSLKLKQVKDEKKKIIENYTSERTMRKKYYNMVEDMKGTH